MPAIVEKFHSSDLIIPSAVFSLLFYLFVITLMIFEIIPIHIHCF